MAGTLTIPKEDKPVPAVILVSGSGPQDRNETVMGHRPFLVLSDHLTRQGIAVLRFDDRGIGDSTGDFSSATTKDFASDVRAGIDFLNTRKEIDRSKIGIDLNNLEKCGFSRSEVSLLKIGDLRVGVGVREGVGVWDVKFS